VAHGVVVASFQAFHPETGERETKKLVHNFPHLLILQGFSGFGNKWEAQNCLIFEFAFLVMKKYKSFHPEKLL